jgi:hypothetical protein
MVNILDRFEQGFERLVEGSIGRLFRSPVQPAEIGRKLERAMNAHQVASVGATLVPNDYRVAMNPRDMVLFSDFVHPLCRQMEQWLAEVADERGYAMIDRVRVAIAGDEAVPRRAIQVTAAIADRPEIGRDSQEAVQRTEVYRVIRATGGVPPVRLRFVAGPRRGQELLLRKAVTSVGRALDNDLVLEGGDVSRHHARFEYASGELRLVDLGSTNGTRLNGKPIRDERVRAGDEIAFGTFTLRLFPFDDGHA